MYNLREQMEMPCVKGNQPRFVAQAKEGVFMLFFGILVILFKRSALRKKEQIHYLSNTTRVILSEQN